MTASVATPEAPSVSPTQKWAITLTVMVVIAAAGALYFGVGRPDRGVARHVHDDLEPTGAERTTPVA